MSEGTSEPREKGFHQLVRFVGLSEGVQPILTFGISVLIARTLGPEGRGAYGLVVTIVAVLPLVTGLGLGHAVRYWAARGEVDRFSLLKTASLLGAGFGALAAGAVLVSYAARLDWVVPSSLGAVGAVAFAAILFMAVVRGLWTNYLAGLERYGFGTWGVNASIAVQVACLALCWRTTGISVDVVVVVLGVQFAFSCALFLALVRRDVAAAARSPLLPAEELRGMLRFGWWQYLASLLMQTNMRANVLLLNALGGLYETGLYTAVLGPAGFLGLVSSPVNLVLSARTARRHDDPTFPARVAGALRLMVLLMGAGAGAGAAVAPLVLPWLLGEEFRPAVRAFRILLPGVIAYSVVLAVAQYLQGARRPDLNTRVSAVGAVLTVVLSVALIPRFGADGAAVAFSVTFGVVACVAVRVFLTVSGLPLRELLAFRAADWIPLARVVGLGERGPGT